MKSLKAMITGLFLVGCTSSVTYETISAKDAKEMMGTQDVVILDVREESEYQQGHIREAQLYLYHRFKKTIRNFLIKIKLYWFIVEVGVVVQKQHKN